MRYQLLFLVLLFAQAASAAEENTQAGFLVNILYPTDSIDEPPDKRLGWTYITQNPFNLLSHQADGRFKAFVRPVRYEGYGMFYVEQAGSHSIVVDAKAPPLMGFATPKKRIRNRQPHSFFRSSTSPTWLNGRPAPSRPYNMVEQAYYDCQLYVDIDNERVTGLKIASEFDSRFAYQSELSAAVTNYETTRYTAHDFNRQRCGFREQNVGNIDLEPGVHRISFGFQCKTAATFVPQGLAQFTEFVPVTQCPAGYNYMDKPNPYPGNEVELGIHMRKAGTGEPLLIKPLDTFSRVPRK